MLFKNTAVGLDIGSSSIKLAVLKKRKKGYELVNFAVMPVPPETIIDGVIERPEIITETLHKLFLAEKLKTKNIITSLCGQSLVIKKINLPKMTEQELEEAIRVEAEQYIPFDIDEVNFDFQVIKENISKEEGEEEQITMDVLLIAARKEIIEERQSPLLEAGLTPDIVDLDVFALENINEFTYGHPEAEVLSLVNIGASFVNINILVDGITELTRDIPMGGNTINHQLQKAFEIEYEEAERMKLGIDLNDKPEKEVAEVVYSAIKEISHEINKMFHNFIKSTQKNIDKVILSGGSAKIDGIEKILTDHFDVPTEIMNPFLNIHINSKYFSPDYIQEMAPFGSIAIGLALRNLADRKR